MLLFRTLILFILFSFNAIAQISKEDVKQVFLDANSGNHKAQNALGGMYYRGMGFVKIIPKRHYGTVSQRKKAI